MTLDNVEKQSTSRVETILDNNHPITPEEADKAFEDEIVREAVRKDVFAVDAAKKKVENVEEISLFKDLASITPKSEEATVANESTQVENSTLEKTEEEKMTSENPTKELQTEKKATAENSNLENAAVSQDTIQNMVKIESDKISFEIAQTVDELLDEVEKSTEDNSQYLTKNEIETLLDDHMKRIEGIITSFGNSYSKLENPTQAETYSLLKQMFEAIRQSLKELRDSFTSALKMKKDNLVDKVDDTRLFVKNGINRRILTINDKLKSFATRIDNQFALEEKNKKEIVDKEADVVAVDKTEEVTPEVAAKPKIKVKLSDPRQESVPEETTEVESEQDNDAELLPAEFVIEELVAEVFNKKATSDTNNWKMFASEENGEDLNAAFQSFVEEVKAQTPEAVIEQFYAYFYEGGKAAYDLSEIENSDLLYTDTSTSEFINRFDDYMAGKDKVVDLDEVTETVYNSELQEMMAAFDYQGIESHLQDSLSDYLSPKQFTQYLKLAARMPNFTQRNLRLLLAQKPNIHKVANLEQWKKMGAQVKQNPQTTYIYTPVPKVVKDEDGVAIKDEQGNIKTEVDYKLSPVFDSSQVEGIQETKLDLTDTKQFSDLYLCLVENSKSTVKFVELQDVQSQFDPLRNQILIAKNQGKEATLTAIISETIHKNRQTDSHDQANSQSYNQRTFESQCIAYVVASHLGLNSIQKPSFDYLKQMAKDNHANKNLSKILNNVSKESKEAVQSINKILSKGRSQGKVQNKFEERLQAAQEVKVSNQKQVANKSQAEATNLKQEAPRKTL